MEDYTIEELEAIGPCKVSSRHIRTTFETNIPTGPTHFDLTRYLVEDKDGRTMTRVIISRTDTGMILGMVLETAALFGDDNQNALRREFMSHDQAIVWLKAQAKIYAGREDVDFAWSEGDSQIVQAKSMPQRRM